MRNASLALAVLLSTLVTRADDITLPMLQTPNGTYSNVTVTTVTASDIFFISPGGGGNARLNDLSPELQKRFGYDPAKAEQARKAQAQANSAYVANIQAAQQAAQLPGTNAPVARPSTEIGDVPIPHPEISAKSFLGGRAPDITVEKWLSPVPDVSGKFLLVDFWLSSHAPSLAPIPELNRFNQLFHNQMVVVGLTYSPEADIKLAVKEKRNPVIQYYSGIDAAARTWKALEIRGLPHCILLDPKGIVRYEGDPAYLNEQILRTIFDKYGG
jgi:thiol-disulfide isomerase/thioredoxin